MSDSNVSSQLIRLQNALLEGRIDRDTYEQLKSDLLKSFEAGNGSPSVATGEGANASVEPPPENPFKKKADFPRVIKSVKFRDLTQPPAPPTESKSPKPTANEPPAEKSTYSGIGGTRATMKSLPVKEKRPRAAPVAEAPPVAKTYAATARIKQSSGDAQTWKIVGEIAAHCGIVMGLRSWAVNHASLSAAATWGVGLAVFGGVGALLWKTVHDACLDYRDRDDDAVKIGVAQFAWTILLVVAASFWVYLGVLYGGLVGTVVGGRFGFLTGAGGELIGGLFGLAKAIQSYRSSRERMEPQAARSQDVTDDEDDDDFS